MCGSHRDPPDFAARSRSLLHVDRNHGRHASVDREHGLVEQPCPTVAPGNDGCSLTALTLWTLLHWWHGRSRPRRWLWIGLSLGLAVLVKSFQAIPIILDCRNDRALRRSGLAALREESQKAGTDRRWSGDHRLPAVEYRTAVSPWQRFVEGYALIHFKKIARVESVSRGSSYYLEALNDAVPHWWVLGVPAMLFAIWRLISTCDRRALLLLAWLGIPFVLYLGGNQIALVIVLAHRRSRSGSPGCYVP